MAPRDEEVRTALEMLPINILRKIIEERSLNFTSRRSGELIDRLLEEEWTEEDFSELRDRLALIQRERQPYSRYILTFDGVESGLEDLSTTERISTLLETREADFDDDNDLLEPGFKVSNSESDLLEGIHWTESLNYTLTPTNQIKKKQTLYETGFEIDLSDDVVFIDCTLPAKASGLVTQFRDLGINASEVGHEILPNSVANEYVQSFVDEMNTRLLEDRTQQTVDGSEATVLEVDLVNILLDDTDLRDIKIGGRTDIMENSEVERIMEEHDSRIVRLEGEFELDHTWYKFIVGYTEGMGHASVKKKGKIEERPELVEEAFNYLYESFHNYFIEI